MSKEKLSFYEYVNQKGEKENYGYSKNKNNYQKTQDNLGKFSNSYSFIFSEAVEINLTEVEEFQMVVDGAILKCTGCPYQTTMLNVSSQSSVYIQGKLVATKKDKKPILNITHM